MIGWFGLKILCNLYDQWISAIRRDLSEKGFNHLGIDDRDCAIRWVAWKRRTVPDGPRNILKAEGFNCPNDHQEGLADLEKTFISGKDIWRWQTINIDNPEFKCEDRLYNDWGVHHFHLGIGYKKGTPYKERTNPLLFALVDKFTVYEIGIYYHGDWYERDMLEIIDKNWPNLLDRFTLRGVRSSSYPQNNDDIKLLRGNNKNPGNVNYCLTLNSGRVIVPPGGGYATNGTSIEAVRYADSIAKSLISAEKIIISYIEDQIRNGLIQKKDYTVTLHLTKEQILAIVDNLFRFVLWEYKLQ